MGVPQEDKPLTCPSVTHVDFNQVLEISVIQHQNQK